jgi:hypothetical protein
MASDYLVEYYNDIQKRQPAELPVFPTYRFRAKDDETALKSSLQYLRYLLENDHPFYFLNLYQGVDVKERKEVKIPSDEIECVWNSELEAMVDPRMFKRV